MVLPSWEEVGRGRKSRGAAYGLLPHAGCGPGGQRPSQRRRLPRGRSRPACLLGSRPAGSTHPAASRHSPVPGALHPREKGQPGLGHVRSTPPLSPRAVTSSVFHNEHRLTFTEQVVGQARPERGHSCSRPTCS